MLLRNTLTYCKFLLLDDHLVSKIWVAGPRLENLQHWKDLGANITTKNGEVVDNCDIIFLGVKPGILSNAIAGCSDTLSVQSKSVLFVSMLVGISIENIHKVSRRCLYQLFH